MADPVMVPVPKEHLLIIMSNLELELPTMKQSTPLLKC